MASIVKRGKTWEYRINRVVGGKRRPITKGGFTTKREAAAAATEIEAKLNKGITPHLKLEPFDEYFENWIDVFKPNIKDNTRYRYLNTLKTLQENFSGVPIQHVTKRMYQKFLNKYGETRSRESVRKLNTHVRACVRDAIEEGVISKDFTRGISITGKVAAKRDEEKHLNYIDSERLMNRIAARLNTLTYYLLLLALTSGMRFAELVGLTREDFDFENNIINVDKTWGYTKKMHKGHGATKNEQSNRKLVMDEITMQIFNDYFEKTPDNAYGLVFFSSQSKYKVISNGAANKALKKLLLDLKIDPISVHGLRHTHASVLLYEKVSIYYVSERLGHADIETTQSYYAHIITELRERDENITINVWKNMNKQLRYTNGTQDTRKVQ